MKYLFITHTLLPFTLMGDILEVGSNNPGSYMGVQPAINESVHGDTILVWPGTYFGPINFNGKNILLTSFYLYDSSNTTIKETILDGNQEGSVVSFRNDETRDAILNGFTITNGSGTYWHTPRQGGGLFILESSPSIKNCIIRNNQVADFWSSGGGIYLYDRATPYFSNIIIKNNFACGMGGGILSVASTPEFDPIKRCNIFLNYSGMMSDIHIIDDPWTPFVEVYLDTFTIADADSFYVSGDIAVFDIQNHKIELVDHDLYVAPWGDNLNTGLTADEPLQNIYWALTHIKDNPMSPNTIYLSPGVFSKNNSDEFFPLNTKSYVSIMGSLEDSTIFSLDEEFSTAIYAGQREKHYSIENLHLKGLKPKEYQEVYFDNIIVDKNLGLTIKNFSIQNQNTSHILVTHNNSNNAEWFPGLLNNFIIDNFQIINNEIIQAFHFGPDNVVTLKNSIIANNTPVTYDNNIREGVVALGMAGINEYDTLRVYNTLFVNNLRTVHEWWGPSPLIFIVNPTRTEWINNTIVNNTSEQTGNIQFEYYYPDGEMDYIMVNNIFWGNDHKEFIIENPLNNTISNLVFSHNIIEDRIWNFMGDYPDNVVWEDGNLESYPAFSNNEDNPYTLSLNSPAIDAGTALFIWEGDTIVNYSQDDYIGNAPDIGAFEFSPTMKTEQELTPSKFNLSSPFPNPFNPTTTIKFSFNEPPISHVTVDVININGTWVETPVNDSFNSGQHQIHWTANHLPSGVYFLQFNATSPSGKIIFSKTEKVVLLK